MAYLEDCCAQTERCHSLAERKIRHSSNTLGKEAEDQPGHEMVDVMAALGRSPLGLSSQKLKIEPVQSATTAYKHGKSAHSSNDCGLTMAVDIP